MWISFMILIAIVVITLIIAALLSILSIGYIIIVSSLSLPTGYASLEKG